jgi:hypothetical protein
MKLIPYGLKAPGFQPLYIIGWKLCFRILSNSTTLYHYAAATGSVNLTALTLAIRRAFAAGRRAPGPSAAVVGGGLWLSVQALNAINP